MTISTETFIDVQIGSAPNDGSGDDLRTAFTKVNQNFSNISSIGFDAANINVSGDIESTGNITTSRYFVGNGSALTGIIAVSSYNNTNVAAYLPTYYGNVGNVALEANLSAIVGTLANINSNLGAVSGNITNINQSISNVNVAVASYLPVYSGNLQVGSYAPTANNSPGSAGQLAWDSGYVYICIATNTWKRANISTW